MSDKVCPECGSDDLTYDEENDGYDCETCGEFISAEDMEYE